MKTDYAMDEVQKSKFGFSITNKYIGINNEIN